MFFSLKTRSRTGDGCRTTWSFELNQQSAECESEFVNKLVLSKKKRHAQTKCTADTGRLLHIYKSSLLTILQSVPLWVFGNEAESDKAQTLHENTAFFPCSLNARSQLCMTNWEHFAVPFASLAKLVSSCLFLPALLSRTTKSAIRCRMPGEHKKQKELTFTEPEFICIPALPSPHVAFYELTRAKH